MPFLNPREAGTKLFSAMRSEVLLNTPRRRTGGSWWTSALEKMSVTIWSPFGLQALVQNCDFRTITDPVLTVFAVVTQETNLRPTRPWVTSPISCVLPGMANTEGWWRGEGGGLEWASSLPLWEKKCLWCPAKVLMQGCPQSASSKARRAEMKMQWFCWLQTGTADMAMLSHSSV